MSAATEAAARRTADGGPPSRRGTLRAGVIGYGYWGPNIVRNLQNLDGVSVAAVCDHHPDALARAARALPGVKVTADPRELLTATDIDLVAIITPVWTHYELAMLALEHGKHIFVEKPFTSASWQAEAIIERAAARGLTVMVDHTFLFSGAVRKIQEIVSAGSLGPLYYFDSTRVNLGMFQHDVSVVWDLAPHDLSVMDQVIDERPEAIVATGSQHLNGQADMAFITVFYQSNLIAHVNVNWLSPVKVRTTLIGGRDRMLVWNDLEPDEKVKVYDKGVEVSGGTGVYDLLVSYRSGDVWAPRCEQREALHVELEYLVDCIVSGRTPMNDGVAGLRIVRLLEAAERSIAARGSQVRL